MAQTAQTWDMALSLFWEQEVFMTLIRDGGRGAGMPAICPEEFRLIIYRCILSRFKKIEIISSIFSDHNAMRLEINYRGKNVKISNTWRLNNTLLNYQEITEDIKE